ncbi:hypothetical protein [Streptomyces noursei]|uniref:hypothetical protein n=1 Tax=Streptomyces noursei TaxID=1971 RepID=UPI00196642BD|nr:hypothetical protein [Streptomyces noursei]QRX90672.1 hypothetical protein JNO44_07370 [Streptomyces noursei]
MATSVPDTTAEANEWTHEFMVTRAGRALSSEEQAEYGRRLAARANSVHTRTPTS